MGLDDTYRRMSESAANFLFGFFGILLMVVGMLLLIPGFYNIVYDAGARESIDWFYRTPRFTDTVISFISGTFTLGLGLMVIIRSSLQKHASVESGNGE